MAIPSLTETIDNAFVHTWYEIRAEAIDNILDATPVWAVLSGAGALTPQTGGRYITRTIKYGEYEAVEVARGDTLPQGDPELETMAIWDWKYIASHVQRSIFDDQINNGPEKIKDLVGTKLTAARDSLEQRFETDTLNAFKSVESGKIFQGINDMIPPVASRTTGTYGRIERPSAFADSGNGVEKPSGGNTWWGANYLAGTYATIADDLLTDLKKLYNSTHNNQSPPNLMLTTQEIFEVYEEFAFDLSQIVKDETTRLADLGFEVLRFKGKPFVWTPKMTDKTLIMLNTDFVEIVYDPAMWFDMTGWKAQALEEWRIAHILCAANMITTQPRRHGRLLYS